MDELDTKIGNLINAVQMIATKVDELAERVDELDSVLFDGLIGPANEQIAQQEYDDALSDFRCKFGEKLEPYSALTKAVEGDDFDVVKKAFDTYNESEFDFPPEEYVDKLADKLADQAKAMADAANAAVSIKVETDNGTEVEVTADENGNVETNVEDEKTDIETTETETKEDDKATEDADSDKSDMNVNVEDDEDSRSKWRKVAEKEDFSKWLA